jgi:excinuclease ABC subunit A
MKTASEELDHILIRGAREHNLKSVEVKIPKRKLVVFTGVSGSGKSSLAFDTLYAEGQRRYVESLSAYARQFLGQMEKPKYDMIRGLSPTISIEQKTTGRNPRSTVGTITEISDYLRVLYARVGIQHCHLCRRKVQSQTAQHIAKELSELPPGTRLLLLVPLLVNRKGEHRDMLADAKAQGFVRLRVDGELIRSDEIEALDKRKKHTVEAVVDRLVVKAGILERLTESVESALKLGNGALIAATDSGKKSKDQLYSEHLSCSHCSVSFPQLSPQAFSFNSPQGMCEECNGLGTQVAFDPDLLIPDKSLTLEQGALKPVGKIIDENKGMGITFHRQVFKYLKIPVDKPFSKLTPKQKDTILHGTGETRYKINWGKHGTTNSRYEGIVNRLMRRFRNTSSEGMKRWYSQFLANSACHSCHGVRLKPESASVRVADQTIVEVSSWTIDKTHDFFTHLKLPGASGEIATEILKEICNRLNFLVSVGLSYLSLDRLGPSLSGGESQRIRLASQVGSELSGVIYILDEPSIGLHQRDNEKLLKTLCRMRDIGNTVVVVEHDEETIRLADYVVDFGPGAGVQGGHIVHAGSAKSLEKNKQSLTGNYLSGRTQVEMLDERRQGRGEVVIEGARANNLKNLTVSFPLGVLNAVTGVSGAGKSTLVNDILHPALARHFHNSTQRIGEHDRITGLDQLDKVVAIDQRPIGRTPRSNPVTYIKVFDEIRIFFSKLPGSSMRGYKPGRFSFNVKGGRCEACQGDGVRKIEMHFLSDVFVKCEECDGRRFNEATLEVKYQGKSIADVLDMTIAEAVVHFSEHPKIVGKLQLLVDVGLDYLHLGQPSSTLSGGEAQRIKLARELSKVATGKTFYILDEPTTGLHFDDVRKLLVVLNRLVDAGNSVTVIEHNLDVIKTADWVIDIGPDGGPKGGKIVAQGTPEQVTKIKASETGRYLLPLLKDRKPVLNSKANSKAVSKAKIATPTKATTPTRKKAKPKVIKPASKRDIPKRKAS